ncbi:MAG TPA: PIG-L family deacetylase [Anaerolineae bacterium]|nr:PIG-L family deacetylase [Anaerolineae bacterium]
MRIMAVGAHPDDVEVQCAGTMARYAQLGHQVTICVCCSGSGGHMHIPPDELARIREGEARKAAALIDAEFIWLGVPDGFLMDNEETRLGFTDAIRRARPDVIITHSPEDYHPDHVMAGELVFTASFLCGLPNIATDYPAHLVVPPIYYMDTPAGKRFLPTEYVDITETIEIKRQMLACHESQLVWLRDHDDIDVLEFMELHSRVRGMQCGVACAEGFRQADVWPRTPPRRLLP